MLPNGNGSAMRVSPVGWVFDTVGKVLREAERSAEGCAGYCFIRQVLGILGRNSSDNKSTLSICFIPQTQANDLCNQYKQNQCRI
jgi:hypothetical protein